MKNMHDIDQDTKKNAFKKIYMFTAILVGAVFFAVLYGPVKAMFFETDLWWMVPAQFQVFSGKPFLHSISTFLFDPYKMNYLDAAVNVYYYVILSVFGPQAKYLIAASVMIHVCISTLFFLILRKSGSSLRVSFLSALAYFALFTHFQAYMWPMAAYHLIVIFFSLLVFYLYLVTNEKIREGRPYRSYFWLTLFFNFVASFCQIPILILPVTILAHILFSSKDGEERVRQYDTWLPLFMVYLGYPLMKMVYIGQYHLSTFFLRSYEWHPGGSKAAAEYLVAILAGMAFLFLFRYILRLQRHRIIRWLEWAAAGALALILFIYLAKRQMVRDVSVSTLKQSFISPLNLVMPFIATLNAFVEPLKDCFSMDSTKPYYFIPFRAGIVSLAAGLFFIGFFFKKAFCKNKDLIIFLVFYFISLRFLWGRSECPSRHMVYVSFLVCVASAYSVSYLYDIFADKIRLKGLVKEVMLVSVIAFLCVANILAVRVALARDKLANTFYIYDYMRVASFMKDDIAKMGGRIRPGDIYVNGVPLMPFREFWQDFVFMDPSKYYNFRFALTQAFDDRSMFFVNISTAPEKSAAALTYSMDRENLTNAKGEYIEPFFRAFNEAMNRMASHDHGEALPLFQKAAYERPFLINYLLPGMDLVMAGCVTNRSAIRPWINELAAYQRWDVPEVEKNSYILATMNGELDAYEQCLFFAAYLEYRSGNDKESQRWLSRTRYIEQDYNDLSARLKQSPAINSDADMMLFLDKFGNHFFNDRKDQRPDGNRYGFIFGILKQ